MKSLLLSIITLLCFSCIPLRIAPDLNDGKIIKSRKLKKHLPQKYAFGFNDPKNADEFYQFMWAKFDLNDNDTEKNIAITIEGKSYFLSFYEVEKSTQTLNLVPVLVDGLLISDGCDPILEDLEVTERPGNWYIAMTLMDTSDNDCLGPEHPDYKEVTHYLKALHQEYLTTQNYNSFLLKE